jgi:hypothetical protein
MKLFNRHLIAYTVSVLKSECETEIFPLASC